MIIFSSSPGSACKLVAGKLSLLVFPSDVKVDGWKLMSHPQEELADRVICWPGEYDFEGVTVRGVGQEGGRQVSYVAYIDGVRCAFIDGPILDWTDADQAQLGDVDVLLLAADNAKKVAALVEAIDPRSVILFSFEGGDVPGCAKALGAKSMDPVAEHKVKPGSLPSEAREVVILK